ncbi:hypothetical protein SP90_09365 [Halodesulfovibrio spirochaetisodalis]|uniref:HDOD domain-containing protein n=2 Tax=Halodesulfovibrio spirochaetisodalis TaxID=1560234 RepID=A0A1B7XCC4_9BACT|nr:hypothetical protein SP90_09365 [Halodesulfovibrio spirochaetisodalis]
MTISSLEIGQTLSCDVQLANGRRLFSAGHIVTGQTLRVLKIWGVQGAALHSASTCSPCKTVSADRNRSITCSFDAMGVLEQQRRAGIIPDSFRIEEGFVSACCEKKNSAGAFLSFGEETRSEAQANPSIDAIRRISMADIQNSYKDFPEEFFIFIKMLNNVYITPEAIIAAIEKKQDLKEKLLRICERLVYISNCEIKSVYSCTAFLGSRTVLYLAIMLVYIDYLRKKDCSNITLHYIKCAITKGVAARYIAAAVGGCGGECFFSRGFLRNIGCLFYVRNFPVAYKEVRRKVVCGELDICTAEERYIGINHAALGGRIVKWLGFPASIEKNVREHHIPFNKVGTREHAVMNVAAFVAQSLSFNPAYDIPLHVVDSDVWAMLNFSEDSFSELVEVIYLKSKEIIRLAYGE